MLTKKIYKGYAILFNEVSTNDMVILPTSAIINTDDSDRMKANGEIVDYEIDDIGVLVSIESDDQKFNDNCDF